MFYSNLKHQWIFRAACIVGVAVEGVSLLRKVRGSCLEHGLLKRS